jgi:hypothetical protein
MPAYQRPDVNAVAGLLARLQRSKPRPDLSKLTCGIKQVLDHAIGQHRKQYRGAMPKCIELHPALAAQLYAELHPVVFQINGQPSHRGIEITITSRATAPRLINCRNEVECL